MGFGFVSSDHPSPGLSLVLYFWFVGVGQGRVEFWYYRKQINHLFTVQLSKVFLRDLHGNDGKSYFWSLLIVVHASFHGGSYGFGTVCLGGSVGWGRTVVLLPLEYKIFCLFNFPFVLTVFLFSYFHIKKDF